MEDLVMKTLVMNENTIKMNQPKTKTGFLKVKDIDVDSYRVIHPLFDVPEEKVDIVNANPLVMSKTVKWSLISLRAYLIIMVGLAFYRTLVVAHIL
jgi:hypothetical protein